MLQRGGREERGRGVLRAQLEVTLVVGLELQRAKEAAARVSMHVRKGPERKCSQPISDALASHCMLEGGGAGLTATCFARCHLHASTDSHSAFQRVQARRRHIQHQTQGRPGCAKIAANEFSVSERRPLKANAPLKRSQVAQKPSIAATAAEEGRRAVAAIFRVLC